VSDALFVYGSLRSEIDNLYARHLRENADLVGRTTVPGSIFRIGKYPGYRREPEGIVHGELWHLHDPEATLAALDDYEGPEYSRIVVNGAWIYIYTGVVDAGARIQSGDFLVL
jgi:gamma-glutamylcyclotransferase (GGCT)/AIG2-like uncharacterized protein YtfP